MALTEIRAATAVDVLLTGQVTGGHVANSGTVTVYYYVLDTLLVAS